MADPTITIGAQTTVMTFAQRNAIAQFWPDGGINAVLHNGTNYMYAPGGGAAGMFGETITDLSNWNASIAHVATTTNIPLGASTAFDSTFAGGGALYFDSPSGILIGLYHGEHNFGGGIFYSGHGLAYSTDFGVNWHKLGPVVLPQASFATTCGVEVGNGTLVSDGTFLYDYYSDMPQSGCPSSFAESITVARASIASVVAAAQAGTPFTSGPGNLFMKYTGSNTWNGLGVTNWANQSGGGGAFTAFFGANDNLREPVVRFNAFINQYVMTYAIGDQSAIAMRFSPDPVSWGAAHTIVTNAGGTVYYPSMLNISGGGVDPQAIGQNFALFFIQPFGGVWTSTTIQRIAITLTPVGGGSSGASVYTSLSTLTAGVTPSLAAMQSNAVQCTPGNGTWNGGSRANMVVTNVAAMPQFGGFNLECGTATTGAGAQMLDYTTASPTPTGPNANFSFGALTGRTAISMGWDYCMNFDQAVQGGQYSGSGFTAGQQINMAIGGTAGSNLQLEIPGGANNSGAAAYHGGNCLTNPTAHRWITLQLTSTTASMNVYDQTGTTLLGHSSGSLAGSPASSGFFEIGISGAETETPGFHIYNGNLLFDLVNGTFPLLPPSSGSQFPLWQNIIATNRAATDWQNAGVIGGIPSGNWTQSGTTIAAGASAATIQTALNACAGTNKYVLLGPGTFTLTTHLNIPGGCELRGSGSNSTFLNTNFASGFGILSVTGGAVGAFNQWTAGYAQGTTQITVSSVAGVVANQTAVILDQCEDNLSGDTCTTGTHVDNGQYHNCTADPTNTNTCGETATNGGGAEGADGSYIANRYQAEIFLVTNVTGNVLTLDHGLDAPQWSAARTPHATYFTPIQFAGISNLAADTAQVGFDVNGSGAVLFSHAANCWAHNCKFTHGPSASTGLTYAFHNTIDNNYISLSNAPSASSHHAITEINTTRNLIQNNIMQGFTNANSTEGFQEGSVIAYNLVIGMNLTNGNTGNAFHAHSGGDTHQLYEGNIGANGQADTTHGFQPMKTWFRNFFLATDSCANGQCGTATSKSFQDLALSLQDGARYHNVIGNVFGTPNVTNTYQAGGDNVVYSFSTFDPLVASTLFRWGNYDTATGATRFCIDSTAPCTGSEVPTADPNFPNPVPASHNMPPSFYLASKPAFFGSLPWPAIGPDVSSGNIGICSGTINGTPNGYNAMPAQNNAQCANHGFTAGAWGGHVNATPALNCWLNTMGGPPDGIGPGGPSILPFDANTCYPTGSSGAPTVTLNPTSLPFGTVFLGARPNLTTTLSNTGTAALLITSIQVQGVNQSEFVQSNTCSTSVGIGNSCTATVIFTPTFVGNHNASLVFNDNASGSPQSVPLTGTVITPPSAGIGIF